MNFELENLFKFQFLIAEMQQVILDARKKNVNQGLIDSMILRVDKLLEIYKTFDKYYYSAHFARQKILTLEFENQELRNALLKIKEENDKLLKSIKWN